MVVGAAAQAARARVRALRRVRLAVSAHLALGCYAAVTGSVATAGGLFVAVLPRLAVWVLATGVLTVCAGLAYAPLRRAVRGRSRRSS